MPKALTVLAVGAAAGSVASAAMDLFQRVVAKPFGATGSGDSATLKAADGVSAVAVGAPVAQRRRAAAGQIVHYATGTALGIGYVVLARAAPRATLGFGAVFSVVSALILDDAIVTAFGWGATALDTPANVHAYSLASHLVFGVTLEGARYASLAAR